MRVHRSNNNELELSVHRGFAPDPIEVRDEPGLRGHTMETVEIRDEHPSDPKEFARLFRALSHPIRLRMLNLMSRGSFSPEQLAEALRLEPKIVSKHLVYFQESNLLVARTVNRIRHYEIRKENCKALSRLINLVVGLLERDAVSRTDVAILNSRSQERPGALVHDEPPHPET